MKLEILGKGLDVIVASWALEPTLHNAMVKGLESSLRAAPQQDPASLKQLDPTLYRREGEPHGYAFQWDDVLAISDILDAIKDFSLSPSVLGSIAWKLLIAWRKIREIRVPLDEQEFLVLLAIKRGCNTEASLAAKLSLQKDQVEKIVSSLQQRTYGNEPIVQIRDGKLVSRV